MNFKWHKNRENWKSCLKEETRRKRRSSEQQLIKEMEQSLDTDEVLIKDKSKEYGDPWSWN